MQRLTLDDRVILVSGGGWNIGAAIARRLAARGARVGLMARGAARLEATQAEIEAAGGTALSLAADVTDADQVVAAVARLRERFGDPDALFACAGGGGAHGPLEEVDPEEWAAVVHKNLLGTFHCARAVLPAMRQRNAGHILSMSGGGAFFPVLGAHYAAYAASKAAICRFTDQLQAELLDTGIHVNCIEPGMVWSPDKLAAIEAEEQETGQEHPLRAHNRSPEDAAELAEFLLGPDAAEIRGRVVSVLDSWWRDPAEVRAVAATVHRYRLRRVEE